MTKIYLIRHGQASFAADDYDQLSPLGNQQAALLGHYLQQKNMTPEAIVIGGMLRHQQTATQSLAVMTLDNKTIQPRPFYDERWNEYDHQNILAVYNENFSTPRRMRAYLANEDNPVAVFKKHFITAMEQWIQAGDTTVYNESWPQFSTRILEALTHIEQQYSGKTILVYTSGGPISLIASHLLGLPITQFIHINLSLVNASVTKLIARGQHKALMLSSLNEHHLFEQSQDRALITYT